MEFSKALENSAHEGLQEFVNSKVVLRKEFIAHPGNFLCVVAEKFSDGNKNIRNSAAREFQIYTSSKYEFLMDRSKHIWMKIEETMRKQIVNNVFDAMGSGSFNPNVIAPCVANIILLEDSENTLFNSLMTTAKDDIANTKVEERRISLKAALIALVEVLNSSKDRRKNLEVSRKSLALFTQCLQCMEHSDIRDQCMESIENSSVAFIEWAKVDKLNGPLFELLCRAVRCLNSSALRSAFELLLHFCKDAYEYLSGEKKMDQLIDSLLGALYSKNDDTSALAMQFWVDFQTLESNLATSKFYATKMYYKHLHDPFHQILFSKKPKSSQLVHEYLKNFDVNQTK